MTAALVVSHLAVLSHIPRGGALFQQTQAPPEPVSAPSFKETNGGALAKISQRWFKVSSLVRFFVSGNLGNLCFYFLERAVHRQLCQMDSLPDVIEEYKDSVSFFVGYLLQIVTQHLIHAVLVYGLETINSREKYFKTLGGQASAYGFALIGSTILNLLLLRAGFDKSVAFFSTMIFFAFINYFLIGWIVRRAMTTAPSSTTNQTTTPSSTKKMGRQQPPPPPPQNNNSKVKRRGVSSSAGLRGGDLCLPSHRWFASSLPIHEIVLKTDQSINVDKVNASKM